MVASSVRRRTIGGATEVAPSTQRRFSGVCHPQREANGRAERQRRRATTGATEVAPST
jgi:hypothetical protein